MPNLLIIINLTFSSQNSLPLPFFMLGLSLDFLTILCIISSRKPFSRKSSSEFFFPLFVRFANLGRYHLATSSTCVN